jgi:hypothetical protein
VGDGLLPEHRWVAEPINHERNVFLDMRKNWEGGLGVPEQKGLVTGDQGDEPPFEVLREVVLGLSSRYTFTLVVETLDLLPSSTSR